MALKGYVIDDEVYNYCDNQGHTIFQSLVYGSLFRGERGVNRQQVFEQ